MLKRKAGEVDSLKAGTEKRIARLRPLLIADSPVTGNQTAAIKEINILLDRFYSAASSLESLRTVGGVEVSAYVFKITSFSLDLGNLQAAVRLGDSFEDSHLVPVYAWWDAIKARGPGDMHLLDMILFEMAELASLAESARDLSLEIDEMMVAYFGPRWPEVQDFAKGLGKLGTSLPKFEIGAGIFARGVTHLIRHQRQFLNFARPIFEDAEKRLDKTARYYQKLNVQLDQQDVQDPGTPVGPSVELD